MKVSGGFFLLVIPLCLSSFVSSEGDRRSTDVGQDVRTRLSFLQRRKRTSGNGCTDEDGESKCCDIKCPAGYYYKKEVRCPNSGKHCSPCPVGTFTALENYISACRTCDRCDDLASQITTKICTRSSDTVCGCKDGFQQDPNVKGIRCIRIHVPKSKATTTRTVTPSGMTSTENSRGTRPTETVSEPVPPKHEPPYILVFSLSSVLLLVSSLMLALCCCTSTLRMPACSPEKGYLATPTASDSLCSPCCESKQLDVCQEVFICEPSASIPGLMEPKPPEKSDVINQLGSYLFDLEESWPATVLYAVIQEVPVRRWKEFLRLLRVPDGQMERVELEAGPCFLEQQYQMLRLWSQRADVTLQDIYEVLQAMDLSGRAQELKDKLIPQEKMRSMLCPANG